MTDHEQTQPEPDAQAQATSKRERVRRCLIEPLVQDGLVRDRRVSAADHGKFLDKLADRLGYLSEDKLDMLRRYVRAQATGVAHNVWPGFVTILNHAQDIETPPDDENPIMQSWLHSRQGEALMARGEHVETYLFLTGLVRRGRPRPPTEADKRMIARRAEEARRKCELIRESIAGKRHVAEDDRQWLAWYDEQTRIAEDIVRAGIAHRRGREDAA